MKSLKKLLPIAATLVLLAIMLVPAPVFAGPLGGLSVSLTDQTPAATANYTFNFTTNTSLSLSTPDVTYTQFIYSFLGASSMNLPSDAAGAYLLETPVGFSKGYQSGGGAPAGGYFSISVNNTSKVVIINYCNNSTAIPAGGTVKLTMNGITNASNSGSYPVSIATRDQGDINTNVDTGTTFYILRQPGEVVATVRGPAVLSVMVTPGGVGYGTLATGAIKNSAKYDASNNPNGMTTAQTQTILNNGSMTANIQIMTSNALHGPGPTNWILAETQGTNLFTHAYNVGTSVYNGSGAISFTKWTAPESYVTAATGVLANNSRYLELELGMPTDTGDYLSHTITVTVLAVAWSP